jgi:hypothetical protein
MTLSPDDVRARIAAIGRRDGFDVAVLGDGRNADPASYGDAGATWWLENVHDSRGTPEEVLELVGAGPPRVTPLVRG